MAASGINEHHEACRKQNIINKRAYLARILRDKNLRTTSCESPQILERIEASCSLFGQEDNLHACHVGKAYRQHERNEVSKILKQQSLTYSAKLSHRFSSLNYFQQW
ncbi:unnamed protein product [Candidula unifasciata]|uniref:Uncharacterized protein n=1 Tax=Candidula unifasciata TaxID=100452 RepID=A0A8S3YME7_9EUPU|nr:unnamed protein product [Candidula unifasciata]